MYKILPVARLYDSIAADALWSSTYSCPNKVHAAIYLGLRRKACLKYKTAFSCSPRKL